MGRKFDAIDERFAAMDQRLTTIDRRFAAIDQRFDTVDRRFGEAFGHLQYIYGRLERLEQESWRAFAGSSGLSGTSG